MNTRLFSAIGLALITTAAGCKDSNSTQVNVAPATNSLPATLFITERPETAPDLLKVKESAKVGDDVVFLARVGGRAEPFAENFALFVVADPSLVSCELMGEEDHCPIPYDYCCEDPDTLTKGIATIQVVDEKGTPLRTGLQGAGGLEGSKFLVVDGVVSEKNDAGLFTVDARTIWVGGKPDRKNPTKGMQPAVPHDHDGDGIADH